jgi:hypothetical protein
MTLLPYTELRGWDLLEFDAWEDGRLLLTVKRTPRWWAWPFFQRVYQVEYLGRDEEWYYFPSAARVPADDVKRIRALLVEYAIKHSEWDKLSLAPAP